LRGAGRGAASLRIETNGFVSIELAKFL